MDNHEFINGTSPQGGNEALGTWYMLHTILSAPLALAVYFIARATYNVFWHPLKDFPGPVLFRATGFTKAYHMVSGDLQFRVKSMHDRYGPVVRIAPNELSFTDPSTWKQIYGSRPEGELSKDYSFYRVDDVPPHIFSADNAQHTMLRRLLAHGFSERTMQAQKPIIGGFVDLLMLRLHENAGGGAKAVDLKKWFNFATFDIIGMLTFGSNFKNLQDSEWHPWVKSSSENNRTVGFMAAAKGIGIGFGTVIKWCMRSGLLPRQEYLKDLDGKVRERMGVAVERPDFIEGLVREKNHLSTGEIIANVEALIAAGSESTATLLSGAVCALLKNPEQLSKLTHEVRTTFKSEEEITLLSVQRLDYMLACLNETFRYYPPLANGMPRVTPKGGAVIGGHLVPQNTVVAIWHWAICHDATLWKDPYEFHPERFAGDPTFSGDTLEALQPFSVGTRNCIGRNLSYAETRLILARLIYNFDMRMADPSQDWFGVQKAYLVWDPPSLDVHLTPVIR